MDQYAEAYRRETYEYLENLEAALLELEEDTENLELINQIFRIFHTIKGSGSMFGFDEIANFTHEIETIYDCVRNKEIPVTKKLIDLTLLACDMIKKMVDGSDIEISEKLELTGQLTTIIPSKTVAVDTPEAGPKYETSKNEVTTYRIRFSPFENIFQTGNNPLLLLDELRGIGDCTVIANPEKIPRLEEMNFEHCYIAWDIILTTDHDINAIKDVFIFVEDHCELVVTPIGCQNFSEEGVCHRKIGEILLERGSISTADLQEALRSQRRLGEVLIQNKVVDSLEVISALKEQEHFENLNKKQKEKVAASSIRVPADRLDALVDLVGELVTIQARLSEEVSSYKGTSLVYIAEEIERLTGELRDKTMNIRMLPIETLFTRFRRVVRDLSDELGKNVKLETEGGETELDKRVIDQLNDPLVHLIRNSIDHGIESPQQRESSKKPAQGKLRLKALHSGDNVLITIEDDGKGLDAGAIRAKAIEKGLISMEAQLNEEELFMQIFAPGFSTASKITGISGRGVGMDVVKKSLDALQGNVSVTSRKGRGTKITLKVPLTLAIVDGLMVKVGNGDYVFPLSAVEECVEVSRKDADRAKKRKMMELRGRMIRYMNLSDYFQTKSNLAPYEKIVIVDTHGKHIGMGVDSVVGKMQTVVKSIGDVYRDVEGISGATIKGDGTIALVLDVNMLSRSNAQSAEYDSFEKNSLN